MESKLYVERRCCGLKQAKVSDSKQAQLRSTELGGAATDRLYPRVTFGALPDDVLLETFELYLGKDVLDYIGGHDYDGWQTLVHVCRRWRCIVFASPCRLDLKIYCTPQQSVSPETLNIWPELPIVINAWIIRSEEDATNAIAPLKHHNRVCKIYYCDGQYQYSSLKEVAKIDKPFPALTSLTLISFGQDVAVLPDSFLGGSAPQLRSLELEGIPCPSIGKLLSSTTNLVRLYLWDIPHSGYIAPEAIVPCLSVLANLGFLQLGFERPRSRAHQTNRHPPPLTRVAFHNLTFFSFGGDAEYLEDILSQIETPVLEQGDFSFFNRLVFDTPLLGHFIRRTKTFMSIRIAHIEFNSDSVGVMLLDDGKSLEPLRLNISCEPLDWQLSAVAQVLNSLLSSLPTLETLKIAVDHDDWKGEIEVVQWLELFHPFTSVKEMTLVGEGSVRLVPPALQELARERPTEVLPTLQILSLPTIGWQSSGLVGEAIEQFIATRQLYGHPVTVDY